MEAIVSKIHASNSTKLSLNDRFTIIQTAAPKTAAAGQSPRRRRRSQSVVVDRPKVTLASMRNRKLVDELERRHSNRRATRAGSVVAQRRAQLLANTQRRQLTANTRRLTAKERLMLRPRIGPALRRNAAGKALNVTARGKLVRANSRTNLATMKADLHGRQTQLRRTNSTNSLAGRLGVRPTARNQQQPVRGGQRMMGRQRMSRQDQQMLTGRRPRLARNNNTNVGRGGPPPQRRSNSRPKRSNSRINLNNIGGVSMAQTMAVDGRRRRAASRSNSVASTARRQRSASVNSRLGIHQPNANAAVAGNRRNVRGGGGRGRSTNRSRSGMRNGNGNGIGTNGVIRGRIFRRRNSNAANMMTTNGSASSVRQRLGRSRSRNAATGSVARGRSRSRSRANRQLNNNSASTANNNNNNNNNNGNRGTRRGRSRGRKGRTPVKSNDPTKSKEDLDNELDQYMANTNNEMDELMGKV